MFFKKKKPKRLYYPTKSKWYRRPRRRKPAVPARKLFASNIRTGFSRVVKDAFLYILAFMALIFFVGFFLLSNRFSINTIEVARSDLYIDNAAIINLLSDYKGKSIFRFSKADAQVLIEENFPEFSSVSVIKLLPDKIKIEVETHPVVANVRAFYLSPQVDSLLEDNEENEDTSDSGAESAVSFDEGTESHTESKESVTPVEQRALINSIGQAILNQEEDPELMTLTIEGLKKPIKDRKFVITTDEMQYLLDTIKYFNNLIKMEIKGVSYLTTAREIHLTTTNDLVLWLTVEKDYEKQLDKFNRAYKERALDQQSLAYIDLRPAEKVIYCPRGAACDQ